MSRIHVLVFNYYTFHTHIYGGSAVVVTRTRTQVTYIRSRGSIESLHLQDGSQQVLVDTDDVIDDMYLDSVNGQLYWTEAERGCIRRAPTRNMSLLSDVICGLDRPQSIDVAHEDGLAA